MYGEANARRPYATVLRSNVRTHSTGLRRIDEYCFPSEDRRVRQAYDVPSGVNNILVINRVIAPGRLAAILVRGQSAARTPRLATT